MPLRILLVGYYGKGNFGDDVLLTVTYQLLKDAYPQALISVIVDGNHGAYVQRMLGEVTILPPGRHGHFDVIVHGGGGVFFDFNTYSWQQQLLDRLLRAIGYKLFIRAEYAARWLAGKQRTSTPCRVGMGIGVGTYNAGSPRLRERLPILADFKALWVRDPQSVVNLQRFASIMRANILQGSDLAFLTSAWCKEMPVKQPNITHKPRLGIVLRDWPHSEGKIAYDSLSEMLSRLSHEYTITGFIFDARADTELHAVLSPYETHVWQPEAMTIRDYATRIAQQDILLASRAHAAICGACLGVPSVIVAIEPKLRQVADMLPNSSQPVSALCGEEWMAALKQAQHITAEQIARDVELNRQLSTQALAAIRELMP